MSSMLENWAAAGLIAGSAYGDEMNKLAALRMVDLALAKKDVDEKTAAGLKNLAQKILKSPATKIVGAGALAAGAGVAGNVLGKKKQHEKDELEEEEELKVLAPQVFRAGFEHGARAAMSQREAEEME